MRVAEINKEKEINANMLVGNVKKIRLDENKKYKIKVLAANSLFRKPVLKKVRAKLVQQTDFVFAFRINTKSGFSRIEVINKVDYLNNKSLIEVI